MNVQLLLSFTCPPPPLCGRRVMTMSRYCFKHFSFMSEWSTFKFKEIKFRIQKAKVQLWLPLTGTRKWSEPGPATFTKTLGASSTSGGSTSRQGGVGKPKGVIYCMRGWTIWQAANCFQATWPFPPNIRRYCKNKNYKTLKPRDLNVWGKKKKLSAILFHGELDMSARWDPTSNKDPHFYHCFCFFVVFFSILMTMTMFKIKKAK